MQPDIDKARDDYIEAVRRAEQKRDAVVDSATKKRSEQMRQIRKEAEDSIDAVVRKVSMQFRAASGAVTSEFENAIHEADRACHGEVAAALRNRTDAVSALFRSGEGS